MIPSIETIVEDLMACKITKSQAVTWLNAHAEGAVNELRDHFAAWVIGGMAHWRSLKDIESIEEAVQQSYSVADAMLKERNK